MESKLSKEEILRRIRESREEDYDGHTDFEKLTPEQKLIWLSSTAHFVYTVAKNNPHLGCARLFNIDHKPKKIES